MDEHVIEMYRAYTKLTNALANAMSEPTKESLEEVRVQREIFLAKCDNAEDFVQRATHRLKEIETAYYTKAALKEPEKQMPVSPLTLMTQAEPRFSFSVFNQNFGGGGRERELVSDARGGGCGSSGVDSGTPPGSMDSCTSKKI